MFITAVSFIFLINLVSYLQMSCSEVGFAPVLISDCQPDLESVQNSQINEELPSSDKNNPKQLFNRKGKCSAKRADIREKWLITQRPEYERKRKVNENEESKQKRLAQQSENKRKNRASESESRRKRLASQSLYPTKKNCKRIC